MAALVQVVPHERLRDFQRPRNRRLRQSDFRHDDDLVVLSFSLGKREIRFHGLSPINIFSSERQIGKKKLNTTVRYFQVKSKTKATSHRVEVDDFGNVVECSCLGFTYNRDCRHVAEIERFLATYAEIMTV